MSAITTIVHFTVPPTNVEAFLARWRSIAAIMSTQPGALHGTFYRTVDHDSPFQFINVAHWASADALRAALAASAEHARSQGLDIRAELTRLEVDISQNNFTSEVVY